MTDPKPPVRKKKKHRVFKIGDIFAANLIPAHFGVQTSRRLNTKRCFIQNEKTDALAGNRWCLRLVSENPAKTVYFADLVAIIGPNVT